MATGSSATARVAAAAAERGIDVDIRHFPEGTKTSADAAAAIGCAVAAIAKSVVLHDEQGPLLVIASGAHRIDLRKVAALLETQDVRQATAAEVREATSFVIGGTAPFGHPAPLRTLMDARLMDLPMVWASAGTPTTVFSITPQALQGSTEGILGDVAEAGRTV